jgi:hypothetical protein
MIDEHELVEAFLEAARLAHVHLSAADVRFELLPAPHRRPSRLPTTSQAAYGFFLGETCLKVGKAGPKTEARFTSQHYGTHTAKSTLALSLLKHRDRVAAFLPAERRFEIPNLDDTSVGTWIERNTPRAHLFLPTAVGAFPLSLLEAFLQCRFRPIFEGKIA